MKNTLGIIAGLLLIQNAQAQLLVDHFSYGNGNLGAAGIGDTIWTGGDSPAAAITVNSTATLAYSGLAGDTGSGLIFSGGTFKKKAAPFTSQSGNGTAVYCSFLLNVQTGPSTVKAFVYLQNGNSASSSPPLGIFLNGSQVGLAKSASSPAVSSSSLSGGTHLIVACYTFLSGNDQVDLWVDPTSLGGSAPSATLTTGTSSSSDAAALSYIFLNHAASQTLWVDEVRVGTTWADVTPVAGATPPPAIPYVTQTLLTSDGLVLRGTNGPVNQPYAVLAAADLTLPRGQWTAVNSNAFDGQGNFDCTNPVSPANAVQFYQLFVGVVPPPPVTPTIVTNPISKAIAVGQTAVFTVAATGTAPLVYRWYFNTNTLLASTTATLTINNAQLTDTGVYSVIVSNVAGTATSDYATLTVTNILAAPSITTQPQNQSVTEGQSANFSVTATGTAPLVYQWYFNTSTLLTDKTNATLTLTAVQTNDAGGYSVIITNSLGSATSIVATLTVNLPSTNGGPLQILQAEDATFTGIVDTQHSGYTGTGFVDTENATGSYIEWEYGRQQAGTETVYFRYAHGKTDDRSASLTVNGVVVASSVAFPPTGSFTSWQLVSNTIPVVAGRNTLRLTALNSAGLANMDRVDVSGDPQYKLNVVFNGRGNVQMSPTNEFGYFDPGTIVTLTAVPLTNATFVAWSGALSGTNNPEMIVVDANKSVTATFQNQQAFNLYVSPTGNDSNPGTIDAPFYSLSVAVAAAFPGDNIYMRGGTYSYSATVTIDKAGNASNVISILAYPGEHPVLDYSTWQPANETIRSGARGIHITTNAQYWMLQGLEIQYAPDNGIKSEGGHITFDRCVFHHNGDTGLQIGLNKDTLSFNPDPEHAAAYNYVLNCDSYRNADPATSYENADGFACKLYAGVGNRFNGCRAWENVDDGWDCFQTEYLIVIENCWSWHNGDPSIWGFSSFNGDGNGFKLGGDNTFCPILIQNCVALNCQWGTTVGFAFNNNTAPTTLYNCSALNCGRPYKFDQAGNIFKNCLDWNSTRPAPVDISSSSTQVNNSWNLPVTVTAGDFASVSETDAVAPREADGSLPNSGFARLVSGSDLIDKGVDVGLPFNGSAPDLGAFEFVP